MDILNPKITNQTAKNARINAKHAKVVQYVPNVKKNKA